MLKKTINVIYLIYSPHGFVIKVAVQMQIFLKTFARQMIPLRVESSDTIADVKVKILNKLGHPPEEQHMLFAGKRLDDHHTIAYYNI
jgi:ubiquitin C